MVDAHQDAQKLLKERATGTTGASGTASTTGTSGTTGSTSVSRTRTAHTSGVSASIDNYASTTLPSVQQHLQQAKDLQKRVKGEGKGPTPARPPPS
jgi:hypothetical protein